MRCQPFFLHFLILSSEFERENLRLIIAHLEVLMEAIDTCSGFAVVAQLEGLFMRGAEDRERLTGISNATTFVAHKGSYHVAIRLRKRQVGR